MFVIIMVIITSTIINSNANAFKIIKQTKQVCIIII